MHIAFLMTLSVNSYAEVQVEWFMPQVRMESRGVYQVTIEAQGPSLSKITIPVNAVPILVPDGRVRNAPLRAIWKEGKVHADRRGMFDLRLRLPEGTAQVPVQITTPEGESRVYQLSLVAEEGSIELAGEGKLRSSPYAKRNWALWAGTGFNYLSYEQESQDTSLSIELTSFDFPTISLKVDRLITETFLFQATYNKAPGKATSSPAAQVAESEYEWTFFTADLKYFFPQFKRERANYMSEIAAQVGAQYHDVPFLSRSSTTDPTAITVKSNLIALGTVGATWLIHYGRYLLFETYLRYQFPFFSGSLFDVSPKIAFDGSVGFFYKWTPDWRVGLFWYGQYHQYGYSNHKDKFFEANGGGGPNVGGDQSLLFSTMELRLGWEFD